MKEKSLGYKIMHFPLTKILIGFTVIVGVYVLAQNTIIGSLSNVDAFSKDIKSLVTGVLSSVLAVIAYWLLFKFYEKREITELSTNKIGKNIFLGLLLGIVLQSLTILVIYLKGGYTVTSTNSIVFIIPALTLGISSAIFEETLIRGVLFRIIEEKLGSYIALLISALIFGALHITNPNSSLVDALGLAIQAGLLLGVAYMYTRNLWFPIALHFAWNFMQSGIYGASVSGHKVEKSLFNSEINGADWFTGGDFGPEGSIQATVFCLVATIILLRLCQRENKIIPPFWKTNKPTEV